MLCPVHVAQSTYRGNVTAAAAAAAAAAATATAADTAQSLCRAGRQVWGSFHNASLSPARPPARLRAPRACARAPTPAPPAAPLPRPAPRCQGLWPLPRPHHGSIKKDRQGAQPARQEGQVSGTALAALAAQRQRRQQRPSPPGKPSSHNPDGAASARKTPLQPARAPPPRAASTAHPSKHSNTWRHPPRTRSKTALLSITDQAQLHLARTSPPPLPLSPFRPPSTQNPFPSV